MVPMGMGRRRGCGCLGAERMCGRVEPWGDEPVFMRFKGEQVLIVHHNLVGYQLLL